MPPVVFIGSTQAVPVADVLTFTNLPARAQPGDLLVAIVAAQDTVWSVVPVNGTWGTFFPTADAGSTFFFMRREMVAGDGPSFSFNLRDVVNAPVSGWAIGTLMVYRGVTSTAVSTAGQSVVASTSYPCPTLTATTYSDIYIGMCLSRLAGSTFTPPAGCTERVDYAQLTGGVTRSLSVFDTLPEATGATGAKTATASASSTGLAASVLLAAKPVMNAAALRADAAGAIGFTSIGV